MSQMDVGNVLVIQSGGCTNVLNRSLYGVVDECLKEGSIGKVFGATHGIDGLLSNRFVELHSISDQIWRRIIDSPGAVLGSSRHKVEADEMPVIFHTLKSNGIRFCFIIGGNDSANTGHALFAAGLDQAYELTVICVPKTIDNDLVLTDHCPGYGSAARFIAFATLGAGRDAEAMGMVSPVTVIEVMGRDAGWLAASSILAKREERDAPHAICVPEFVVDGNKLLDNVENTLSEFGCAVIVVAGNTKFLSGDPSGDEGPDFRDPFGHPYYQLEPGRYLAGLINERLDIRTRYENPGTIQRSMVTCISQIDASEAEKVGRAAVRLAVQGENDVMVTLQRHPGEGYSSYVDTASLSKIMGQVREMPRHFFDPGRFLATPSFVDYASPLIGDPLPAFERLI